MMKGEILARPWRAIMPIQSQTAPYASVSTMISILSLHTYPVKSCAGITHTQVGISPAGLAHDRRWVVIDAEGRFLTQRAYPQLALVQPMVDESALFLNAPEMPTLRISLRRPDAGLAAVPLRIWGSDTLGDDEGNTAARWFSDYLGTNSRLYRVHPDAQRLASPQRVAYWLNRRQDIIDFPTEHVFGFADGYPFLIAGQTSLDDLNLRLATQNKPAVGMSRFRPNIVLQGLEAYEEDYISSLRIGRLTFALVKPCARCPMPNVDPATAEIDTEPMETLSDYRRFDEGIMFGVNAVVGGTEPGSVLSVGDRVDVVLDL